MLFLEAPSSVTDVGKLAEQLAGPVVVQLARGWSLAGALARASEGAGLRGRAVPVATLLAATAGVRRALGSTRAEGTPSTVLDELHDRGDVDGIDRFTELVGIDEIRTLESAYES